MQTTHVSLVEQVKEERSAGNQLVPVYAAARIDRELVLGHRGIHSVREPREMSR